MSTFRFDDDYDAYYQRPASRSSLSDRLDAVAKEFEREREQETAELRAEVSRLESENEYVRLKSRQELRKFENLLQDAASNALESKQDIMEIQHELVLSKATIGHLSRELVAMRFSLAATELERKKQRRKAKALAPRDVNLPQKDPDPAPIADGFKLATERAAADILLKSKKIVDEISVEPRVEGEAAVEQAEQAEPAAEETQAPDHKESAEVDPEEGSSETHSRSSGSWQEVEGSEEPVESASADEDCSPMSPESQSADERTVCVDGIDLYSRQGLLDASAAGDLHTVQQIFVPACDFADFLPDIMGAALSVAAVGGHEEVVDTLIRQGADAAWVDSNLNTCVHTAASSSAASAPAITRLLLSQNAGLDACNSLGKSPLHVACSCGNADVVQVLLLHGADLMLKDADDCTAADLAEEKGHERVLEALGDATSVFWNQATFANLCYKQNRMEEAIDGYQGALDRADECEPKPTNDNLATIHLNCARAHAKIGQLAQSCGMCTLSLELQPRYVSGLVQRAVVLLDLCAYVDAVSDFELAVAVGGDLNDEYQERYEEALRLKSASHFYWLGAAHSACRV
eukprot:TRINITY_DN11628_c0_g1_i2.p1 TRINITY_DN11628_c0_g1~~TRINITY_DN11628_c0_g1_i2.p1  ORF type:complete len:577 (+),score=166.62 TRINITY_DN11628_c0_g1_i2:37-1767(+)